MSFKNGVYLDEDTYFQHKFGDVGMSFTSSGAIDGLSNGEKGNNVFSLLEYGNMKMRWSAGLYDEVSFVFVRDGKNLDVYVKASSLDRYYYVGKSDKLAETGTIQFASYNSARASGGLYDLTMKDIFYTEDIGAVVPTLATVNNATVTMDKTSYNNAEKGKLTVTAAEGYLVTAVTVNGVKKVVTATAKYEQEIMALSPVGINVSAVETVAKSTFVSVKGSVTIPEANATNYNKNGTITYTNANGIFTGTITDGNYEIKVPAGKYDVKVSTGEYKTEVTEEITAAVEGKNYALNTFDDGYFKTVTGTKMNNDNGTLKAVANGATVDTAIGNVTFTPKAQVLEMGYTIKGNMSAAIYPMFGFMIKETDAAKMARIIYTFGAGDQVGFTTNNDYSSRLGASDRAWELWKGGFIPGQTNGAANASGKGTYNADAYCNLSIKLKVDGYNLTLSIKGTNKYMSTGGWREINFEDWTTCFENLSIYDRYNAAAQSWLGELYGLDKECYFGVSSRQDMTAEYVGLASYSDFWYTVTDKTAE